MTSEIAAIAKELKSSLKQFPNFPQEGILFEDFLPIFAKPDLFQNWWMLQVALAREQKSTTLWAWRAEASFSALLWPWPWVLVSFQ